MKSHDNPSDWLTSHHHPDLRPGLALEGRGLFAEQAIARGQTLVTWGGQIVPRPRFDGLERGLRALSLQIDDDLFLVPTVPSPADCVNHACEPNAGMSGQIALVALRDIETGEEITYDYAMSDGSAYDEFPCLCGAPSCRGRITGDDWRRPELWQRYDGHFSPYLRRRIERLRAEST